MELITGINDTGALLGDKADTGIESAGSTGATSRGPSPDFSFHRTLTPQPHSEAISATPKPIVPAPRRVSIRDPADGRRGSAQSQARRVSEVTQAGTFDAFVGGLRAAELKEAQAVLRLQRTYRGYKARVLLKSYRYQRWLASSWTLAKLYYLYTDLSSERLANITAPIAAGRPGRHVDEADPLDCEALRTEVAVPDDGPVAEKGTIAASEWHLRQVQDGQANICKFITSRAKAAEEVHALHTDMQTVGTQPRDKTMNVSGWMLLCSDSKVLLEHRGIKFACETFRQGCVFESRVQALEELRSRTGQALGFRSHHFAAMGGNEQAQTSDRYGSIDAMTAAFLPNQHAGTSASTSDRTSLAGMLQHPTDTDIVPVWHKKLTLRAFCHSLYLLSLVYMKVRYKYDHIDAKQRAAGGTPAAWLENPELSSLKLYTDMLALRPDAQRVEAARLKCLDAKHMAEKDPLEGN
jgi:hypothetical protein